MLTADPSELTLLRATAAKRRRGDSDMSTEPSRPRSFNRLALIIGVILATAAATVGIVALYQRDHTRDAATAIPGVALPAGHDNPDLTGQWVNGADSTYPLRLIDNHGDLTGSMVMPIDDNHGGVKPEQYSLTGSFRTGTISLALDQGLGVKLSVSGRLTTDGALQLDWTSSAGNLVEWTYRARSDESAAPPPTTNPPITCEGYRQRDHADYKCDGDYFADGSQIPDDAPMALRPPASGPCPKGYPTVSHFQCTTPTIPPDQWPPNP